MNLILSRLAELDLEEIWLYTFETWSIDQANIYQDILFDGMNSLNNFTRITLKNSMQESQPKSI